MPAAAPRWGNVRKLETKALSPRLSEWKGALGVVFTHIMGGNVVSRLQTCNYLTTYPKHGVLSLWWAGMCGLSIMMRVDNTHAEMAALVYS